MTDQTPHDYGWAPDARSDDWQVEVPGAEPSWPTSPAAPPWSPVADPAPSFAPTVEPPRGSDGRDRGWGTAIAIALVAALLGFSVSGLVRRVEGAVRSNAAPSPFAPLAQGSSPSSAADAVATKVDPGVVDINTKLGYQSAEAAGTGVVLTASGEVLTNNHVVDGATSITATVVTTGRTYTARVVGTDPTEDVAVLQLEGASGLKTVTTADSSKVAVGASVVAIGNAGGVGGAPSVVSGTVVALAQAITATDESGGNAEQLTNLIQTNAPLQPGDSGGPLADTSGRVIGMDTAASSTGRFQFRQGAGEAFAIPINQALSIARQIASGQSSSTVHVGVPGFLGIEVADTAGTGGATQPQIQGAVAGSPAAQAGLAAGDVVTAVDGRAVSSAAQLSSLLKAHHPGDHVALRWTDPSGVSHQATVTLTTGPAD